MNRTPISLRRSGAAALATILLTLGPGACAGVHTTAAAPDSAGSSQTSNISGRTMVSLENIGRLNADLLATCPAHSLKFVTTVPTLQAMPVVTQREYAPLQPALARAVAFPSSVSLGWAPHQLIPVPDKAIHP